MLENAIPKHRDDEHNHNEALELAKSRPIDLLYTDENKFVKFLFNVNSAYWKLVGFSEWANAILTRYRDLV